MKYHEVFIAGQCVQAVNREVRAPLTILKRAGNSGGAFPVIAHQTITNGRVDYWFARKFRSHAEALAFVNSLGGVSGAERNVRALGGRKDKRFGFAGK